MGIREIAQEANVSIATVSRVLNKPKLVNENTRNKVLTVIKQNEYKKYNRFIIEQEISEIAVIIPNIINSFFARVLQGINTEAYNMDFIVNLFLSDDDVKKQTEIIDLCIKKKIKAVIIIKAKNDNDETLLSVKKLKSFNIPFVLVDRDIADTNYSGIFLSNANAVYEATSLLVKNGYKKIAVLRGDTSSLNSKQRIQGYKRALEENNISYDENIIIHSDFSIEGAYEVTLKLLENRNLPDVIFAFTNELSVGCIKALKDKNIDIKVFSFNKIETNKLNTLLDISYIEHDAIQMGAKSVKILKNKLVGTKGSIREILDYKIYY